MRVSLSLPGHGYLLKVDVSFASFYFCFQLYVQCERAAQEHLSDAEGMRPALEISLVEEREHALSALKILFQGHVDDVSDRESDPKNTVLSFFCFLCR